MRVYDATGMGLLENYIGPTYAPTLASLRDRQAVVFGRASSCNSPIIVDLNNAGNFHERYWAPRANTIPLTQPPAPESAATIADRNRPIEEKEEPESPDDDDDTF